MSYDVSIPTAGHYKMRLVRDGPFVAVKIWYGAPLDPVTGEELDRSHRWQDLRSGISVDIEAVWPFCAKNPINKVHYDFLLADASWAKDHAPDDPAARPRETVDLTECKTLF